jgi:hypothetical protein
MAEGGTKEALMFSSLVTLSENKQVFRHNIRRFKEQNIPPLAHDIDERCSTRPFRYERAIEAMPEGTRDGDQVG